jgi:hypothetical protein
MHEILPHPFFGGQHEVFFSDDVENICVLPVGLDAEVVEGQV